MRITQSWVLESFRENFEKRWGTVKATKYNEPMVVFGCFHQVQVDAIMRQDALVVLVWVGSDSLYLRTGKYGVDYSKIIRASHVKHVAISRWISDDLSALDIPHIYLPITHVDFEQFKPTPLGDKVYCYCPNPRPELYGAAIIAAVQAKLPDIKFIITGSHVDTPHFMMQELYDQCFVGLRPTSHDGQPTTVAEMGLMGRRVIHNGLAPNCISWHDGGEWPLKYVDDIVKSIRLEQQYIGNTDADMSEQVRKFLDIGEDWLNTEFYGGHEMNDKFNRAYRRVKKLIEQKHKHDAAFRKIMNGQYWGQEK